MPDNQNLVEILNKITQTIGNHKVKNLRPWKMGESIFIVGDIFNPETKNGLLKWSGMPKDSYLVMFQNGIRMEAPQNIMLISP